MSHQQHTRDVDDYKLKKAKTGCKNSYSNSKLTVEFELIKLNWDFETILC